MDTISIKYCDIPTWLHAGDFYRNLSPDDPEDSFEIPADRFVKDNFLTVSCKDNWDSFCQLVRVSMYWMLDEIPVGILEGCVGYDTEFWHAISSVPGAEESRLFEPLLGVYPLKGEVRFKAILQTNKLELILHAARRLEDENAATAAAARKGDLRALKYLHEEGLAWNRETCWKASQAGHVNCLQYAHENGCPWDIMVYKNAARNGHLHIMQYACQQGLEWHEDVCRFAAFYGHLDCLQFAHEQGCPWDEHTSTHAAQTGQLATLRYAMEQGCPYEPNLVLYAAQSGCLECLQYLLEDQALYMDKYVFMTALLRGNLQCLQYLIDQGCPYLDASFSEENSQVTQYDTIFVKDNLQFTQCVQYAVERGWETNVAFCKYVMSRDAECVGYLQSEKLFAEEES